MGGTKSASKHGPVAPGEDFIEETIVKRELT